MMRTTCCYVAKSHNHRKRYDGRLCHQGLFNTYPSVVAHSTGEGTQTTHASKNPNTVSTRPTRDLPVANGHRPAAGPRRVCGVSKAFFPPPFTNLQLLTRLAIFVPRCIVLQYVPVV